MPKVTRMYDKVEVWNPQVGCLFDCRYCEPTFKAQAKRQRARCERCYEYTPHEHPERLAKMPRGGNGKTLFVCSSGDISFASPEYMHRIINAVRCYDGPALLQSKRPEFFAPFLAELPRNVILGTTLETNRDERYELVSKAPPPNDRWRQFYDLKWPRKAVTAEPLMDFGPIGFANMIELIGPEHIWIGYNSRPKQVELPEPPEGKVIQLMERLVGAGIDVRGKDLRGLQVPEWQPPKNTRMVVAEQERAKGW